MTLLEYHKMAEDTLPDVKFTKYPFYIAATIRLKCGFVITEMVELQENFETEGAENHLHHQLIVRLAGYYQFVDMLSSWAKKQKPPSLEALELF